MLSTSWDMFKPLYAVESLQGYTAQEIELLKGMFGTLPQVLEEYYRTAGQTQAFHHVQDIWILPEHFQKWEWLHQSEYMILLNENQGVCRAGIRREDLCLPNPPVYSTVDDKNWVLCAPTTSEFLSAALAYEAVFCFAYCSEEFYWLTEDEVNLIQSKLTKLPFELANWLSGMKITLYNNEDDNMVVIMDCADGNPNMFYGAASEKSYAKLLTVLKGIGESDI